MERERRFLFIVVFIVYDLYVLPFGVIKNNNIINNNNMPSVGMWTCQGCLWWSTAGIREGQLWEGGCQGDREERFHRHYCYKQCELLV